MEINFCFNNIYGYMIQIGIWVRLKHWALMLRICRKFWESRLCRWRSTTLVPTGMYFAACIACCCVVKLGDFQSSIRKSPFCVHFGWKRYSVSGHSRRPLNPYRPPSLLEQLCSRGYVDSSSVSSGVQLHHNTEFRQNLWTAVWNTRRSPIMAECK
jgi:hypothetical protein